MIAPSKNLAFAFIAAGLIMISLFFLTSSPLSVTNLILGGIPLLFLLAFGITILRARKKESGGEGD
jgi:hypothetical protein